MAPCLLLTPDKVHSRISTISRHPLRIDGTKNHRRCIRGIENQRREDLAALFGRARRWASMSFQTSAIFDSASSRLQLSRDCSFAFGDLEVRETVPLAADTRPEVSATGRGFSAGRLRRL
jgi:hypothetical protein